MVRKVGTCDEKRDGTGTQEFFGNGVGGNSDALTVWEYYSQAFPKFFKKLLVGGVDVVWKMGKGVFKRWKHHDEVFFRGAVFGDEDFLGGCRVKGIGTQTIYGFGAERDKTTVADNLGGIMNLFFGQKFGHMRLYSML